MYVMVYAETRDKKPNRLNKDTPCFICFFWGGAGERVY